MKQIDALLQKVELFERLANYGDRKTFLEAIAQEVSSQNTQPVTGTDPKKQLINNVGYVVTDSNNIKQVQTKLKNNGMQLAIDGIWGPESYKAMCDFQTKHQLPISGKLDDATARILSPSDF